MLKSVQAYFESISFLRKHGLTWLLWFPFAITILVFYLGLEATSALTDFVSALLRSWIAGMSWIDGWEQGVSAILYWLFWILFRVLLYFVMAFLGGSIILLLMTPLLTYSSELVASKLGAEVPSFNLGRFFRDLGRAISLALKNGLIQLLLTIGALLIGFIPVIGIVAPFLVFGINAYFYGYNFLDFSLERNQISAAESNRYVWKHRFTSIGLGSPYALWLLVPFIGPLTSGFVALFATVAATLQVEKLNEQARIDR